MGGRRCALRSPGPVARTATRWPLPATHGQRACRRRRQRLRHGRRARHRRRARSLSDAAAAHVLLAFWSAEEIGLVGSNAFVTTPPMPVEQIAAYLNFDMVGRMQDNKLAVQATGTQPGVGVASLERANVAAGFDLAVQADPNQPTDVATFNQAGVPSLSFTTGAHDGLSQAVRHGRQDQLRRSRPHRRRSRLPSSRRLIAKTSRAAVHARSSSRRRRRAAPACASSPAPSPTTRRKRKGCCSAAWWPAARPEQAGLQKGDVIVEIAGQTIANIYDYTYALDLLKIGQPVKVVYMRGSERRETTLTPAARQLGRAVALRPRRRRRRDSPGRRRGSSSAFSASGVCFRPALRSAPRPTRSRRSRRSGRARITFGISKAT